MTTDLVRLALFVGSVGGGVTLCEKAVQCRAMLMHTIRLANSHMKPPPQEEHSQRAQTTALPAIHCSSAAQHNLAPPPPTPEHSTPAPECPPRSAQFSIPTLARRCQSSTRLSQTFAGSHRQHRRALLKRSWRVLACAFATEASFTA